MYQRRVTIFVGNFGSGKTEIALNGALELAAAGSRVTLADLDVVKPYFRSRSARAILSDAGVGLLAPTGANVHADLPIIVPQIRSCLRDDHGRLILDVGGDDLGARVLGSLSDVIPFDDTDCLLVLNFRRPSTPDPERAVAMVREDHPGGGPRRLPPGPGDRASRRGAPGRDHGGGGAGGGTRGRRPRVSGRPPATHCQTALRANSGAADHRSALRGELRKERPCRGS